jgi:hypothetical protein
VIERLAKALYWVGFISAIVLSLLVSFQVIGANPHHKILFIIVAFSSWALGWAAKWVLLGRWL